jgi:hypothetical protein
MARRFTNAPLLMVALLASSGCYSWRSESRAPTSPVWRDLPGEIRLTLDDGSTLTLNRPVIRIDQTISSEFGRGPSAALQDISAVEARRFSSFRTFSLVLAKASIVLQVVSLIVDGQPHYRGLF